ncbi:MAG: hypothetical protein MUF18_13895 [Fimbriiglobus sp.]|jgi:hypothetical protein|nr:hypothetical protein [Fimbriiglobus sp.]
MLIAIREQGVGLSSDGRAYAIDRIEHALHSVRSHVRKVMVYLSDQNGPRGGVDKTCRVAVTLESGRPVVVMTNGQNLTEVVAGAADKAGKVVHEEVHRRGDRRRTGRLVWALKRLKRLFGRKGDTP